MSKYKEIMDKIEINDEMRKRIIENVKKKNSQNNSFKFQIKKIIPTAACFIIIIGAFIALPHMKKEIITNRTEMPNTENSINKEDLSASRQDTENAEDDILYEDNDTDNSIITEYNNSKNTLDNDNTNSTKQEELLNKDINTPETAPIITDGYNDASANSDNITINKSSDEITAPKSSETESTHISDTINENNKTSGSTAKKAANSNNTAENSNNADINNFSDEIIAPRSSETESTPISSADSENIKTYGNVAKETGKGRMLSDENDTAEDNHNVIINESFDETSALQSVETESDADYDSADENDKTEDSSTFSKASQISKDTQGISSAKELSEYIGFEIKDLNTNITEKSISADYSVINKNTAEITYYFEDQTVIYRKSKYRSDALKTNYNTAKTLKTANCTVELKGSNNKYEIAVWNVNKYYYSLKFKEPVSYNEALKFIASSPDIVLLN